MRRIKRRKIGLELRRDEMAEELEWREFLVVSGSVRKASSDIPKEEVEIIKVALKYLTTDEQNQLQDRALEARIKGRGRVVRGQFKYSEYARKKLASAIVKWDGVTLDGMPAPINEETVGLLPGWIGEEVMDTINDMNELAEEEEGN